ncbi:MAG: E2/UBC family protein [Streptosporangiaceae bacterium]
MGKTIRINGVDVPVIADQLDGEEIKRLAGIDPDRVLVRQERDRNVIVPDAKRLRVADADTFTHHARHSKARTMSRRSARVRLEAATLAAAYSDLRVADDESYVFIGNFRLPAGWVPDRASVLIVPPAAYPECAPDGFYLTAELRRREGDRLVTPGHYFHNYHNPYADLGYHWYCLEDPERQWRADQDSLITFVEAIRTYLGTAD